MTYFAIEVVKDSLPVLLAHLGVDGLGGDAEVLQVLNLIFDEGDERRYDHGDLALVAADSGRQLVDQRLPAAYLNTGKSWQPTL